MSHNVRDYRLHLEGQHSKYVRDRLRPLKTHRLASKLQYSRTGWTRIPKNCPLPVGLKGTVGFRDAGIKPGQPFARPSSPFSSYGFRLPNTS